MSDSSGDLKIEQKITRLSELDALRGIACLMVFFFHHSIRFNPADNHYIFHFGYLGVDLFFIISGFVIYLTLNKTKHWMDFIVHRFSRLYPAYWLCVLITFYGINLSPFTDQVYPNFILTFNLTMFQHWIGVQDIDLAYWTLNLELSFYFFMLIVFLLKGLKYYIGIVIIMITPQLLHFLFPGLGIWDVLFHNITFLGFGHLFGAGILFYQAYIRKGKFTITEIILLLICVSMEGLIRTPFDIVVQVYIIVFFLLFVLLVKGKLTWVNTPVLLFFGKISYVLYLIHENIGLEILKFFNSLGLFNWYLTRSLLLLVFTLISFLIFKLYERPVQKWINKTWSNFKSRLMPASLKT